ncbi:MAG: hypothetical protein ACRCXM_17125 [Beijerinckiaceae bacterium]
MTQDVPSQQLDINVGRTPQIVQRATQVLAQKGLKPENYVVRAVRTGPHVTVVFRDRNQQWNPDIEGGGSKNPPFEVVIDEASLEVLKAYSVR